VICKIGDSLSPGWPDANLTLSAAAVRLAFGEPARARLAGRLRPDALAEIMTRQVEPALVIGVPVGFVARPRQRRSSGQRPPALTTSRRRRFGGGRGGVQRPAADRHRRIRAPGRGNIQADLPVQ